MEINDAMIKAVRMHTAQKEDEYRKRIVRNRIKCLYNAWGHLYKTSGIEHIGLFTFNNAIAIKVVSHYVDDLGFLKQRYNIPDRAQAPKVAGLMANAIIKYRPLVPTKGDQKHIMNNEVNEFLALFNGLCICTNYYFGGADRLNELISKLWFDEWQRNFIFLLRERNYTSENLILVFDTLCLSSFPEAMVEGAAQE
jgi:hypothetical protein